MSNTASRVKASRSDLVYLARLREQPTDRDAWYYVQVKTRALVPLFLNKIKTGINLLDYSEILYSGWGAEPPEEIKQKIKEQFA